MPNKSISVIGAGSWGTALSIHLAKIGYKVNLWVYEKFLCEQIKRTKEIEIYEAKTGLKLHKYSRCAYMHAKL